ncbi:MAG: protein-glutamate O-methyltransferase [Deltaproteobacteria bacterium]|nr:protein-glutamate O-methyltransferase [Deltaproteobacteria bacterium]
MTEPVDAEQMEITDTEFKTFSDFVYSYCGINLHEGKKEMVRARVGKQMRLKGFGSFDDYFKFVLSDESGSEVVGLINAISTNLTSFYRESRHFDFLTHEVIPELNRSRVSRRIRAWSAGCSTGEEPYTLAMVFHEGLQAELLRDFKILATDISTRVLETAMRGVYPEERVQTIDPLLIHKYFQKGVSNQRGFYKAKDELQKLVHFARLNLMKPFPMKGPFDVIFCRNVMIYFDQPSREQLVSRFFDFLAAGGYFFVGHSESLTGVRHPFKYVGPSIYRK